MELQDVATYIEGRLKTIEEMEREYASQAGYTPEHIEQLLYEYYYTYFLLIYYYYGKDFYEHLVTRYNRELDVFCSGATNSTVVPIPRDIHGFSVNSIDRDLALRDRRILYSAYSSAQKQFAEYLENNPPYMEKTLEEVITNETIPPQRPSKLKNLLLFFKQKTR